MARHDASPEDGGGLRAMMEHSPDVGVHTSVAAESAFLLGLGSLVAAPFSLMLAVAVFMGASAVALAIAGLAVTSRPNVAGGALAPFGLICGLCALGLVGLRYLGVDTAFGDAFAPQLTELLASLNSWLPAP